MTEQPLPTAFIKSAIVNYRRYLHHIFPIPDLDFGLVHNYELIYCTTDFSPRIRAIGDERLFQLPFVTGLCTMIPLGKSLNELDSQHNSGDSIKRLKQWMSETLLTIWDYRSLPAIRALLLAALCYQYNGEVPLALQCFQEAKAMFHGVVFDLGGLGGLEERLSAEKLCDLALASWDFSNFAFLDRPTDRPFTIPFMNLDPAVVRKRFGEEAEDVILKKWRCIMFKNHVASLQRPCTTLEHLHDMLRSIKALKLLPKPTQAKVIYPIVYFEAVQSLANTYYRVASAYDSLPSDAQQKLLPELSEFASSCTEFAIEFLKQCQGLQDLERRRLIPFEQSILYYLEKTSFMGFCDASQWKMLAKSTLVFLRSIQADDLCL